jgi:hypothetical protein
MTMSEWSQWTETALKVTGHFEDSDSPLGGVTGDFDDMGVSLGVLQWNIGMGSLQPMVRSIGRAAVVQAMPAYGAEMWAACNANVAEGLRIVRAWQPGGHLRLPVAAELKRLALCAPFVAQQVANAEKVAERAYAAAAEWAGAMDEPKPDKRLFCWFFDVLTQNGGMKGIGHGDVAAFTQRLGADRTDDVICDWLAARSPDDAGFRDSRRNASLWRDSISDERLPLFVASYLRAMKSRPQYRGDVLNRKATIALGTGWVHGERHELDALLA